MCISHTNANANANANTNYNKIKWSFEYKKAIQIPIYIHLHNYTTATNQQKSIEEIKKKSEQPWASLHFEDLYMDGACEDRLLSHKHTRIWNNTVLIDWDVIYLIYIHTYTNEKHTHTEIQTIGRREKIK